MRKPTTIHAHQGICNPLSALRMIARSSKAFAILIASAICLTGLGSAEEVEITGTYRVTVACNESYHIETYYVVEPGKDKFSGIPHTIELPESVRKNLAPGTKINVQGVKQEATTKKMTKGEVRKAMYNQMKHGKGVPFQVEGGVDEIINKIQVNPQADQGAKAPAGQHNHGELQLKPVADDHEVVSVKIPAHVAVKRVTVLK